MHFGCNLISLCSLCRRAFYRPMTNVEVLIAIASGAGPVFEKARSMIGENELAILIAKAALADTSMSLSPTKVSEAIGIHRTSAQDKIDRLAVKERKPDHKAFLTGSTFADHAPSLGGAQ
jgi:hypothetical protein